MAQVVTTNIRISKPTHEKLVVLSGILGKSLDETLDTMLDQHADEIEQALQLRAKINKEDRQQ